MTKLSPQCRNCRAPLTITMADLGTTPIANDYLDADALDRAEPRYPLRVFYCDTCHLVQLQDFIRTDDVFREDYAYFSSQSKTWVAHAGDFVAAITDRFALTTKSHVVEIASNDGYLLQHVVKRNIRATGIEPCHSFADYARRIHAINTIEHFFNEAEANRIVNEFGQADFVIANNVLAHVPDIAGFVRGLPILMEENGVASFEFPHLLNLVENTYFDTIYHEHFSYLSVLALDHIFKNANLRMFDTEKLATHGGSLRLYVCHTDADHIESHHVNDIRAQEMAARLDRAATYEDFQSRVDQFRAEFRSLILRLKRENKRIAAFGAPAKGNTLLNVCGLGHDMIAFTTDNAPSKQGRYLPGSRIPILPQQAIFDMKPDIVLLLPWNLEQEICPILAPIADWGGQILIPMPTPRFVDPSLCG